MNTDGTYQYSNEQLLLEKLGDVHELMIGGFHYQDCVKRVGGIIV